jgi:hypothetical protein
LEFPQNIHYDAQMYSAMNLTSYRYSAMVGGAYQIISIALALVLVYFVRNRPSLRWTLTGTLFLILGLIIRVGLVAPVNIQIASAVRTVPESVPTLWMDVSTQWEFGHIAGFVAQLIGFSALLYSVLTETPENMSPADRTESEFSRPHVVRPR